MDPITEYAFEKGVHWLWARLIVRPFRRLRIVFFGGGFKTFENQDAAMPVITKAVLRAERHVKIFGSRFSSLFQAAPPGGTFMDALSESRETRQRPENPRDAPLDQVPLQLLMVSPESTAIEKRTAQTSANETCEEYRAHVQSSLRAIRSFEQRSEVSVQLRFHDQDVYWRYFLIDDLLFLGSYLPYAYTQRLTGKRDVGGESCPMIQIDRRSSESARALYECFRQHFDLNFATGATPGSSDS